MKYLILITVIMGLVGFAVLQHVENEMLRNKIGLLETRLRTYEIDIVSLHNKKDKIEDKLIATRGELKKMTRYRNLHADNADAMNKRYWACEERLAIK